jgi:preprotein translocase subunit SecY
LKAAAIIMFLISAAITVGLNYMVAKESRGGERVNRDGNFFIVFWSFVLTVASIWLMVFGPRSLLFQ